MITTDHASLAGQVVLITGGSRGIGRAIALRLAREKPVHIVVGYCMNYTAARQTVADLATMEVPAALVSLDVSHSDQMKAMFDQVRERHGRLDIFVSNAARTTFR